MKGTARFHDDRNPSAAFSYLLPFFVSRFNAGQDFIREEMLQALLKEPKLPFELWEEALPHLHDLWKTCGKGRRAEKNVDTWRIACLRLVERALSLSVKPCVDLTPLHSCPLVSCFQPCLPSDLSRVLDRTPNALAFGSSVPQNRVAFDMVAERR